MNHTLSIRSIYRLCPQSKIMEFIIVVLCIVFMDILGVSSESIECGQSITGNLEYSSWYQKYPFSLMDDPVLLTAAFNFTNDHQQNVTMTTCDSELFAGLRLKNSTGHYIQSQSTNQCRGYQDCASPYCTGETSIHQTTFTMEALPSGEYIVEVTNELWLKYAIWGKFNLFVICQDNGTGLKSIFENV